MKYTYNPSNLFSHKKGNAVKNNRILRIYTVFNLACIALCLPTASTCMDDQTLINHVQQSIANAQKGISKLTKEVLAIEGMSSAKNRHLLNNICSLPNANYLEIGVWKGSTFVAALYSNTATLKATIAIDNFTQFGGPKKEFLQNVASFLPNNKVEFYDYDCFKIRKTFIFKNPITIYFFDGDHTALAQQLAFTYYNDVFADTFIALVDDWNHEPTRIGTKQAFKELNYTILFEQELPAKFNGDLENWWNGLYIAVIKKKTASF